MNVDQLKAFNPGGFTAAASAFEAASTGANSSQSSLNAAAGAMGNWSGPAASSIKGTLSDMRDALSPAPPLLEGAQQVLESFVTAVTLAQDQLNTALAKAQSLGCQVAPDGTVTPPAQPPGQPPQVCFADPTQEAARVKAQNAYDHNPAVKNWNDATQQTPALQSAIQAALQGATGADSRASGDLANATSGGKAFTQVAGGNLGAPLTELTNDQHNLQTDGKGGFSWLTLSGLNDKAGWGLNAWGAYGGAVTSDKLYNLAKAQRAYQSAQANESTTFWAWDQKKGGWFAWNNAVKEENAAGANVKTARNEFQGSISPADSASGAAKLIGRVGLGASMVSDVITFASPSPSFGPGGVLGGTTDRAMAGVNFAASGAALSNSLGLISLEGGALAIPGLDVVAGVALLGTGAYFTGEFVYKHWDAITKATSKAASWVGHTSEHIGHDIGSGFSKAASWVGL